MLNVSLTVMLRSCPFRKAPVKYGTLQGLSQEGLAIEAGYFSMTLAA